MCLYFKYHDVSNYSEFGKLDQYHQNGSSDRVRNFASTELELLEFPQSVSPTQEPQVSIEVAKKYGATLQHLFISDHTGNNRIQIINNTHPTDSGIQWSALIKGVKSPYEYQGNEERDVSVSSCNINLGPTSSCPYPLFSEWKNHQDQTTISDLAKRIAFVAYNQAVGGDSTWMWGMEDPVEKTIDLKKNKISLKTPPGIWIPLFTDFITTIPGRSNAQEFRPRGPFYLPLGMRLLDARTQELSLSKITVPTDGSLISRVTINYLVRAHQNTSNEIGYYKTLLWGSFNRKVATEKKLKIYFILFYQIIDLTILEIQPNRLRAVSNKIGVK